MKKIFLALLTLFCLVGCETTNIVIENDIQGNIVNESINNEVIKSPEIDLAENPLEIHFIDVGQADSILVKSNDEFMLIDAGNNDDANTITSYLKNQNVEELEYIIGTHPHEDHIGSLDTVINNFDINNVIMPKKSTTTKTFEEVVIAIENKNLSITAPKVGDKYELGNAEFTIISPEKEDYGSNLNNYSVGIILTYGENKFVFTGDAEKEVEEEILNSKIDLNADLLKLGHHGSSTSSSQEFLNAVSPEYVVITCGKDNSYGHPHTETMTKLEKTNVTIYRTDLQGNIIVTSDGKDLTFETQKNEIIEKKEENVTPVEVKKGTDEVTKQVREDNTTVETVSYEYILNTNSKIFHYTTCSSVKQMSDKNKQSFTGAREEVLNMGYKSCGRCKP